MGSTGGGHFSDYTGSSGGGAAKPKGGTGGGGGSGGTDECEQQLKDVVLEDVERCEYWKAHKRPPAAGIAVHIKKNLVGGRPAVETTSASEVVGYLPTRYNYVVQCMKRGFGYAGTVVATATSPIVKVIVSLDPT